MRALVSGFATLLAWLAVSGPAGAADLRVRLFYATPPASARLRASPGEAWYRLCHGCRDRSLARPIEVKARANRVSINGNPPFAGPIELRGNYEVSAGGARFSTDGLLEIYAQGGRLRLTLNLPLEKYVAAVLAGEGGGMRYPEARKALAVAIRTFAVKNRGRHAMDSPGHPFDFCDTTHCQDLRLSAVNSLARDAALATEGEILWYNGAPIDAYYGRHCGGTTEDARYVWPDQRAPYLRQLTDTFCRGRQDDSWTSRIARADLLGALRNAGIQATEPNAAIRVEQRSPSGRVLWINVGGRRIGGQQFVREMGLSLGWRTIRSTLFDIQDRGAYLAVTGRGDGHGVGLCQVGAEERAKAGQSYEDILRFYYPGTTLGVNAQGFRWKKMAGSRVDVFSTLGTPDQPVVAEADKALARAEAATHFRIEGRPVVRVYPTIRAWRDATGEPGWVAASTVGRTIRLQPAGVLRAGGILESTLLHEFLHLAVEGRANPALPLWFREGVVLYLADPEAPPSTRDTPVDRNISDPVSEAELRRGYQAARSRVKRWADRFGRRQVLNWISRGLPRRLPD